MKVFITCLVLGCSFIWASLGYCDPEISLQEHKDDYKIVDVHSSRELKRLYLKLPDGKYGTFMPAVKQKDDRFCYRLNKTLKVKPDQKFVLRADSETKADHDAVATYVLRDDAFSLENESSEPRFRTRAENVLTSAKGCAGRSIGSGDCYAFVAGVTGGRFGTPIGTYSARNRFALRPGHILHMTGFNFGNMNGSNHYAIVETVYTDGSITILHQNMGGANYVVRNRIYPGGMGGQMVVYQP